VVAVKPGRHTAEDGSFGRSAGTQTFRGVLLLAVAVVIGIILLNTANKPPASTLAAGSTPHHGSSATTTLPPAPTTTTPLRAPKDVKVLPANGTLVNGAGARVGVTLAQSGYNVLAAVSATSNSATSTVVYYTQGYDREAAALAILLSLPASAAQPMPTPAPVPDTKGANVVVVVGPDLAGHQSTTATTSAAHSTSTTARSTTSTTAHASTTTTAHTGATTTTTR